MLTWSTMANGQQRTDKTDSNTIMRENENASVKYFVSIIHIGIFRWKKLILKGKIQFKNMTMLPWSTKIESRQLKPNTN